MNNQTPEKVPNWTYFSHLILQVLSDGQQHARKQLRQEVLAISELSEAQLARTLDGGGNAAANRVGWAMSAVVRAKLVERPSRGQFLITEAGRDYLRTHPGRILLKDLEAIPAWNEYEPTRRSDRSKSQQSDEEDSDPIERMINASDDLKLAVASDLLTRLRGGSSEFFERAVLDLLAAMGYGGIEGTIMHTGGSGDGGIDGVLDQDALGLNRVHVQSKRYGEGNTIGRPDIQRFVGALTDRGASQGVFVTTSKFSREAQETAERAREKIALIDGNRLVELMIKYKVGVQVRRTVDIVELDEDFFE